MEMKRTEKLNATTSLLGFGAMRLATKADGSIDYETSGAMVDKAVAGGINYFDTAWVYHGQQSEVFLGKALVSRYPRDSFYLATKMPTFRITAAEELEVRLNESLERLQTDYIDFYLLHSMHLELWEKMRDFGVIDVLEKAKKAGKIKRIGFSSHANPEEFQKMVDAYDKWEFVQLQVNYADWETRPDTRPTCEIAEKAGIPLIIMEPVRGGVLADPNNPAVKLVSERLPADTTPASLALRWAAARPNVVTVLSGMSTVAQVEENLRTFNNLKPLTANETAAIDEATAMLKKVPAVPCTACYYCMEGCPQQLAMDEIFDNFNTYLYYKNLQRFKNSYPKEGHRPTDCIGCGACVAVCPQHIDIPAQLKRVGEAYANG